MNRYDRKREEAENLFAKNRVFIEELLDQNEQLSKLLVNSTPDAEMIRLTNEVADLRKRSLFLMSDKESADAKAFYYEHVETCGGEMQYILKPTGIGMVCIVRCSECQTEKDITDIGSW